MTASVSVALPVAGIQQPRVLSLPPGYLSNGSAGQEAVDLAASAGLFLDPWQRYVLEESLRTKVNGRWLCRNVCLIVSRQNGKGSVLEARELFGLYLANEQIIHTAHQFKTSADHFKRIRGLIEGSPDLKGELKVRGIRESHGEESITLKSGSQLRFLARSVNGSGRGFTKIDMLAVDEAYQAGSASLSALLPTQMAAADPQTWYTSSAFDRGEDSTTLIRLRDLGRQGGSEQLGYFEWSAEPDADPDDPVARAQANPGLGIRLPFDNLQSQREGMSPEDFLVEHMSVWPETGVSDPVFSLSRWLDLSDVRSKASEIQAFAVEIDIERAWSTIGAAGPRPGGMHVEVFDHQRGVAWLLPRCLDLAVAHPEAVFAIDGAAPAADQIPAFEAAGLRVLVLSAQDVASACAGMVDAVDQRLVWHGPQPGLDDAVAVAKKRPWRDGGFSFGRRASAAPIGPLVSVTLARYAALTQAPLDMPGMDIFLTDEDPTDEAGNGLFVSDDASGFFMLPPPREEQQ